MLQNLGDYKFYNNKPIKAKINLNMFLTQICKKNTY